MIFLWLYLNAAPFLTQSSPNSQFSYSSPYTIIENAENLSSHIIKYSQPFELVLFYVTSINIKIHKGSHYPHLLIKYLFN